MVSIQRVSLPVAEPIEDGNILPRYPLEAAAWVWHPERSPIDPAILRFTCACNCAESVSTRLHVSADQRYELRLNGELISRGPDRADVAHWAFASYAIELPAGEHQLEATVWWIGPDAPAAQLTYRGGFILAVEGALGEQLNTGTGNWRVSALRGWSFESQKPVWFTGSAQAFDGAAWHDPEPPVTPAILLPPVRAHGYGHMRSGWRLHPSRLPEQFSQPWKQGRLRTITDAGWQLPGPMPEERDHADWQRLLSNSGSLTVPANTRYAVLWDFEDYLCAYWHLVVSGGAGASLRLAWTEALYEQAPSGDLSTTPKGDRNAIAGKYLASLHQDVVRPGGGASRPFSSYWWRAGRYLLITVETQDEPLTIDALTFEENRYPLELDASFESTGPVDSLVPLYLRGMQMCSHETYMDCPYFEQLMYVGDTRLEVLAWYAMSKDDRLPMRAIELFDWSRRHWGTAAEHYPGRDFQQSNTYAMLWPLMLHDFARWRRDDTFIARTLVGIRGNIEVILSFRRPDGLLGHLPGWSFVDWVDGWERGMPPTADDQLSATANLHLLLCLQAAAELEEAFGDRHLAERYQVLATETAAMIRETFWDAERGLLVENTRRDHYSEHAQCLALIGDLLPQDDAARCFSALLQAPDLAPTSIYFSWYLLETYRRFGRGDLIIQKLDYWHGLLKNGLKTPQERPEPTRSDCHAWGSHPYFHYHASLAGIRPLDWGFRRVEIAPSPGDLRQVTSRLPHPDGFIEVALSFADGACEATVTLPGEVDGVFIWQQQACQLVPGRQQITLIPGKSG